MNQFVLNKSLLLDSEQDEELFSLQVYLPQIIQIFEVKDISREENGYTAIYYSTEII